MHFYRIDVQLMVILKNENMFSQLTFILKICFFLTVKLG